MSFVKKGIKAIGKFVKKYWKEILIVAAVVFTAGIATMGVAAFQAGVAANGLLSTVGSTMWAGVTATAGSMGIGSGASTAAFGGPAAFGGATHVGLGAAMGAGGGFGLGAAGQAAMAEAAAANAAAGGALAASTVPAAGIGVAGSGIGVGAGAAAPAGMMPGAVVAGGAAPTASIMPGLVGAGTKSMMPGLVAAGETAGMSTGKALLWSGVLQTAGQAVTGWAQGEAMEDQLEAAKPYASWGVPTDDKGGRTGPVEDYLFEGAQMPQYAQPPYAPPAPMAGDVGDPAVAANQLSMAQANRPMAQTMGGALMTQPGMPYANRALPTGPTTSPSHLMVGNPNLPAGNGLMSDAWRIRPYGGIA